jgi:hypothetical protein
VASGLRLEAGLIGRSADSAASAFEVNQHLRCSKAERHCPPQKTCRDFVPRLAEKQKHIRRLKAFQLPTTL